MKRELFDALSMCLCSIILEHPDVTKMQEDAIFYCINYISEKEDFGIKYKSAERIIHSLDKKKGK